MSLLDCQTCGACCRNTQKNLRLGHRGYVEVLPSDALFRDKTRLAALTVLDEAGVHQMRLEGADQHCVALTGTVGERVSCAIYALRPEGCRLVTPGDEECLTARRALRAKW